MASVSGRGVGIKGRVSELRVAQRTALEETEAERIGMFRVIKHVA